MDTYIALLRGINVSGQKMIKMAELKSHLLELNFSKVQTYIQSGNIIFESSLNNVRKIELLIEQLIIEKYGFVVKTIVKKPFELQEIINKNPFAEKELNRVYVTFLSDSPSEEKIEKIKSIDCSPEEFVLKDKAIYFYSPNGYGNAKMNNNFFENKLKVSASTRNWKTVNVLFGMATNL